MTKRSKRKLDYRSLSTWVQRVVLRVGAPEVAAPEHERPSASSAEEAATCARGLEGSAEAPKEALALRELGDSLTALDGARGETARGDAYAAVLSAAEGLATESTDFANPPLNAIWANRQTEGKSTSKG